MKAHESRPASEARKDNEKEAMVLISLFLCMPIGLVMVWTASKWKPTTKLLVSGIAIPPAFLVIAGILFFINLPAQFKVDPVSNLTFSSRIKISGSAPQKGTLTMNGKQVKIKDEGFSRVMPLKMGYNIIEFKYRYPSGRIETKTRIINRISRAPGPEGLAAILICRRKLRERYNFSDDIFYEAPQPKLARGKLRGPRYYEYKVSGTVPQQTYGNRMVTEYPQPYECVLFYDRIKKRWLSKSEFSRENR